MSTRRETRGSLTVEWAEPPVRDQFLAGIVFNVGRADERFSESGVSHLVEHLALPPVDRPQPRYGGSVTATSTDLWFTGDSPEEVVRLLTEACARIRAVSTERLERERQVLRAEGDRNGHPLNVGLALRFGAAGAGLAGYPQLGLGWLDLADVRWWAQRYLCVANAALWMDFEPPVDLELPLPDGELNVRPAPVALEGVSLPAFVPGRPNELALHLLRPRSAAGVMATQLVGRRLLGELRGDHGLAYNVSSHEAPLTALTTATTIVSDTRSEHAAAAVRVVAKVLTDLAVHGCAERELAEITEESARSLADAQSLPGLLRANAAASLGVQTRLDVDAYLDEQRAVTPAVIASCVVEMMRTALLSAPPPVSAAPGFGRYPQSSSSRVTGRRHLWRSAAKHVAADAGAYVSPEGVSVVYGDGRQVTIDFARVPLMVIVDEARRALWGRDGRSLVLDRENFDDGAELIDAVDRAVPIDRVRVDRDLRREREAVRAQVAVLADARRRLIASLALIALVIAAVVVGKPTAGAGLLFPVVLIARLAWRTVRIKLRHVPVGAITTTVQRILEAGEQLELLATAKLQGQGAGLLILTDRRFVFTLHGAVVLSVRRGDVTSARSSRLSSTLQLRTAQRRIRFDYITRRNRAAIARALKPGRNAR
ncbi:MAG TPA: insulinase family protein [Solirubrobacteraceae bacterium]|nr:insulinase family protein [Solirubrobacteraceae bacterium]